MAQAAKKGNGAPEAVFDCALLSALPDGVIAYSADGQCRSANEAAGRLLGLPCERLLEQNFREIDFWKTSGLLDLAEETMRTGSPRRQDTPYSPAPNESRWLEVRLTRVDIDGEATLLVTLADAGEQRSHALADITSDLMFSFDRHLNLTGLNQAGARILGLNTDEALGRHIADLGLPREIQRRWTRKCSEVLASGRPAERLLNEFTLADGQVHLNETSLWPVLALDGGVVGVQGVTRDITERKQAEELLCASEQRYRTLFDSANDGIVLHDLGGRILEANKVVSERLDYSSEDLLAMNVTDILDRRSAAPYRQHMDDVRRRGSAVFETTHRRRDGSTLPVEVSSRLIEDGGRQVVLSISRDITEHMQAEEALRLTQFSVDRAADSVFWTDCDGRLIFVSDSMCGSHGYARDELLAMTLFDLDPSLSREQWSENWKRIKEQGILKFETVHQAKQGEIFPVDVSANYVEFNGKEYNCVFARDISESKQAEEMLRLTQLTVDRAADMVQWMAPDGRILYTSESICRRLGYSREEMLAKTVFDLNPTEAPETWAAHWRLLKERGSLTFESWHRTKEGEVFPVEVSANYVESGGQELIFGFARDITERKRIEEALRLTQLSVDRAADLIHWIAPDGRVLYVSDSTCQRHGYSREELLGMTIFELDPSQSPDAWKKHWQEIKEQGSLTFESVHRTKQGEVFPVELSVNYVECGGQAYNFSFGRDISERKCMERALTRSEERFRALIENSSDLISVMDDSGVIVFQSPSSERILGYRPEELKGKSAFDFVHPDDIGTSQRVFAELMRGPWHSPQILQARFGHKDGSWRTLEMMGARLVEPTGELRCVLNSRDISERKQAEEALKESEEQLRQAQKMEALGQLAGGIAHDFNNLLTAIIGNSSLASGRHDARGPEPGTAHRYPGRGGAGRLLTKQILAFSRRQVLRSEILCLNSVIRDLEPLLERTLGEDIELEFSLVPDLRETEVDPYQIGQVLLNLALNARDAMPEGGHLLSRPPTPRWIAPITVGTRRSRRGAMSCWPSPIPDAAWTRKRARISSSPSLRPKRWGKVPVLVFPPFLASQSRVAAASLSRASRGRAAPSQSICRQPTLWRLRSPNPSREQMNPSGALNGSWWWRMNPWCASSSSWFSPAPVTGCRR